MKTYTKAQALALVKANNIPTGEFLQRVGDKKGYTEQELQGWVYSDNGAYD